MSEQATAVAATTPFVEQFIIFEGEGDTSAHVVLYVCGEGEDVPYAHMRIKSLPLREQSAGDEARLPHESKRVLDRALETARHFGASVVSTTLPAGDTALCSVLGEFGFRPGNTHCYQCSAFPPA